MLKAFCPETFPYIPSPVNSRAFLCFYKSGYLRREL
jgi:hypothetical protein